MLSLLWWGMSISGGGGGVIGRHAVHTSRMLSHAAICLCKLAMFPLSLISVLKQSGKTQTSNKSKYMLCKVKSKILCKEWEVGEKESAIPLARSQSILYIWWKTEILSRKNGGGRGRMQPLLFWISFIGKTGFN